MTVITRFIRHSNVDEVLSALDDVLTLDPENQTRPMLLIAGLPKTGKDYLAEYWIQRVQQQSEAPLAGGQMRILKVDDIWEPEKRSLGRGVYTSPIACVLFSEIAFELGELSIQISPSFADKTWYREPKGLYTDSQFRTMFSFVRSEVKRLRTAVLIINEAQFLDKPALECLVLLRRHCRGRLGIVLLVQLQQNAHLDEPLAEEFARVKDAAQVCRRQELKQLTEDEYKTVVLDNLVDSLHIDFADDLLPYEHEIATLFWEHTGSDWKLIHDSLIKPLDRELGHRNSQVRIVTRSILVKLLGKELPF